MSDNKQYVTRIQENGTVMISEDVISTIIAQAIADVEGLVGLSVKPGADIREILGMNWGSGIKVYISEDNSLNIVCNVVICYGHSVVDVAKNAQDAIINAVESMTGVKVASVNVNVCGIVRQ